MLNTTVTLSGVKFQFWSHARANKVSNYKIFKIAVTAYANVTFGAEHEYNTFSCHIILWSHVTGKIMSN